MSTFINYHELTIPPASTPADLQSAVDGVLMGDGWQRVSTDAVNYTSDYIPPAGEVIGSASARQIVRMFYNGPASWYTDLITLQFSPYSDFLTDYSSIIWSITTWATDDSACGVWLAGSVPPFNITASIDGDSYPDCFLDVTATDGLIEVGQFLRNPGGYPADFDSGYQILSQVSGTPGGTGRYNLNSYSGSNPSATMQLMSASMVSITGTLGNTRYQNLRLLLAALIASTDPNALQFKYTYYPDRPGGYGSDSIVCEALLASNTLAFAHTDNIYTSADKWADSVVAGQQTAFAQGAVADRATGPLVDLINGTLLYITVYSRTVQISSKLDSPVNFMYYNWNGTGIYLDGPYYFTYMGNACALALVPKADYWMIYPRVSVAEVAYGMDNTGYQNAYDQAPTSNSYVIVMYSHGWGRNDQFAHTDTAQWYGSGTGSLSGIMGPTFYADAVMNLYGPVTLAFGMPGGYTDSFSNCTQNGFQVALGDAGESSEPTIFPQIWMPDIYTIPNNAGVVLG